jgi:hypothetical protein
MWEFVAWVSGWLVVRVSGRLWLCNTFHLKLAVLLSHDGRSGLRECDRLRRFSSSVARVVQPLALVCY